METNLLTNEPVKYFEIKAKEVLEKLGTFDQKQAYARALNDSITLSSKDREDNTPVNTDQLHKRYGFSPLVQKSLSISLNRQQAKIFLKSHGYPVNKKFDQDFNIPLFRKRFGRDPYIYATRQMILTVAEWLMLIEYYFAPELPEVLKEYL